MSDIQVIHKKTGTIKWFPAKLANDPAFMMRHDFAIDHSANKIKEEVAQLKEQKKEEAVIASEVNESPVEVGTSAPTKKAGKKKSV